MRLAIGAIVLLCASCKGDRAPPLTAGEGVRIDDEQFQRVVSADEARVPVTAAACTAGQSIVRAADGTWRCESLQAIDVARFEAIESTSEAVAAEVAGLRTEAETLEQRVGAVEARVLAPRFSLPAFACTVDPASYAAAVPQYHGGRIINNSPSGAIRDVILFCPVFPVRPIGGWTRLGVTARDGDGAAGGESAIAELVAVARDGTERVVASIDFAPGGNDYEYRSVSVHTESFDFAVNDYFLRVTLSRTSAAGAPAFAGFELYREDP